MEIVVKQNSNANEKESKSNKQDEYQNLKIPSIKKYNIHTGPIMILLQLQYGKYCFKCINKRIVKITRYIPCIVTR